MPPGAFNLGTAAANAYGFLASIKAIGHRFASADGRSGAVVTSRGELGNVDVVGFGLRRQIDHKLVAPVPRKGHYVD